MGKSNGSGRDEALEVGDISCKRMDVLSTVDDEDDADADASETIL